MPGGDHGPQPLTAPGTPRIPTPRRPTCRPPQALSAEVTRLSEMLSTAVRGAERHGEDQHEPRASSARLQRRGAHDHAARQHQRMSTPHMLSGEGQDDAPEQLPDIPQRPIGSRAPASPVAAVASSALPLAASRCAAWSCARASLRCASAVFAAPAVTALCGNSFAA